MRGVRLLEFAIANGHETVLDVGVGRGNHAIAFIGNGSRVTGVDVRERPLDHRDYEHIEAAFEVAQVHEPLPDDNGNIEMRPRRFDAIWCCHTLEHIPNVQAFLVKLHQHLKDDGWLYIVVPPDSQNRLHVGHLTLWTPAHLVYNLICAGWDCRNAMWYSEYCSIGLALQNRPEIDLSWRTGMPDEIFGLNQYSPVSIRHENGAWWANNWPDETDSIVMDPPGVTAGTVQTNLPPQTQMAYGPNPKLRKPSGLQTDSNKVRKA